MRTALLVLVGFMLMGAVAGTASRWVGNRLVFDGTSGNNAFSFDVDGLRGDFGSGANDYFESDGENIVTPATLISIDSLRYSNSLKGGAGVTVIRNFVVSDGDTAISGNSSDNANSIGIAIGNTASLTVDGARIVSFYSDDFNSLVFSIDKDGKPIWRAGAAAVAGRATLVGGTVTVNTTAVEASSIIQLTRCVLGGDVGHLYVGTITADTSFVINSSSATETSTICWQIAEAP